MPANGDGRQRCFLGMPGYGPIAAGAARSFYLASRGGLAVRRQFAEGSLLASNMNELWCAALNDCRKGDCDLFAMQHADVLAEDYWLDALEAERAAQDLDVLGVAVPIKDTLGKTSTALARPDGDPWKPLARLTLAEIYRLPETFTARDVGHPLLLNTGLWVCRLDEAWARHVYFTINDRIVRDVEGRYAHQVEPEDWFVSRLFHRLGLKIGCTRKIAVGHVGQAIYGNHHVWGEWDFDRAAGLAESVLPAAEGVPA